MESRRSLSSIAADESAGMSFVLFSVITAFSNPSAFSLIWDVAREGIRNIADRVAMHKINCFIVFLPF